MAQDSFILVNLKETQAKELAQVISNDTSRKILDYLTDKKDATASLIAKDLNVPMPTVHYNLKHLVAAKLVQVDEFHYSPKGKEVDHYKLSNKFVIIAPQSSKMEGLMEKLGKILPVGLITVVGAGVVYFINSIFAGSFGSIGSANMEKAMLDTASVEAPRMLAAVPETVEAASASCPEAVNQVCATVPNVALWFLIGGLFALFVWLLWDLMKKK